MDAVTRNHSGSSAWSFAEGVRALPEKLKRWGQALRSRLPRALVQVGSRKKAHPHLLHRHRRALYGAALVVSGAGLALWAYDLSSLESLDSWLRGHSPDPKTWVHALGGRGLVRAEENRIKNQALRSLPISIETAGNVWIGEDRLWIAIFQEGSAAVPSELFCFQCKEAPARWVPMGRGWPALESVLATLDERIAKIPVEKKAPVKPAWRDPREIRF